MPFTPDVQSAGKSKCFIGDTTNVCAALCCLSYQMARMINRVAWRSVLVAVMTWPDGFIPNSINHRGKLVQVPMGENMAAYDRLPAPIRRRLSVADVDWSSRRVEQVLTGELFFYDCCEEVQRIIGEYAQQAIVNFMKRDARNGAKATA